MPRRCTPLLEGLGEAWLCHIFVRLVVLLVLAAVATLLLVKAAQAQVPSTAASYKRQYTRIVRSEWGLDVPVSSLAAQIHQESGWDCKAMSRVGARSCAQFMPTTAKWANEAAPRLKADEVYSPAWSFRAQAWYMKWLRDRVKADTPCERMAFAMSSYNGGLGYVYKRQKVSRRPGICFGATCDINPGITPANQKENADYPRRILRALEARYVNAGWGLGSCATS